MVNNEEVPENCTPNKYDSNENDNYVTSSNSKLRGEDLKELMTKTDYDEFTIREWYNSFIQDCPNRKLTLSKCTDLHKILLPNKSSTKLCKHLIELFDKDHNGYIDFKEFISAIHESEKQTKTGNVGGIFRLCDIDHNGFIGVRELFTVLQLIYGLFRYTYNSTFGILVNDIKTENMG